MDPLIWRMIIATNVDGPFYMARAVVPHMLQRGTGSIINISMNDDVGQCNSSRPRGCGAALGRNVWKSINVGRHALAEVDNEVAFVILKGICHPDDARRAIDSGTDAIYCSNHGGRQANGGIAAIDMLPAVVAASADMPVLFDFGVRSGTDVVKALAMGARAVGVGRPYALRTGTRRGCWSRACPKMPPGRSGFADGSQWVSDHLRCARSGRNAAVSDVSQNT